MKKLFVLLLSLALYLSVNAQKYTDYLNQGVAEFNAQNYQRAEQLFLQAENKGCKTKHLYYYYAVCAFYNGKPFADVEENLLKALIKKDLRAAEFYAVKISRNSDLLVKYIYSNSFSRKQYPLIFFCRANIDARKNQAKLEAIVFEQLQKSLQLGYVIPQPYLRFNAIEKFNKHKYYQVLANNGISLIHMDIEKYVEIEIAVWQKKGKFEKTSDYKSRVTEINRTIKTKELMQSYIDKLGYDAYNFMKSTNEYDADNEVFKINFDNSQSIYLPVPIAEAQAFDLNFKNLKYENASFTLLKNKPELLHVEILNPGNNKTYVYDSHLAIAFNSNELNLQFDAINIEVPNRDNFEGRNKSTSTIGKSDVDLNVPETGKKSPNKYALIIGNENYQNYQTGLQAEQNVAHAINDALVFKEYCIKTLGIPTENIIFRTNAGVVQMQQTVKQMCTVIKNMNGEAEVIVYYAGHGFPDEKTKEPYLIPVDVSSSSLNLALPLHTMLDSLSAYPSKKVMVFLDACFTGGGRNMGLLASRGIKIVPKEARIKGNLIVFSASKQQQSALPFNEKAHGLFTYYLLKKIQESKGNVKLGELDTFLNKQVSIKSTLIHSIEQNPKTQFSTLISDQWKSWNLN